MLGKVGFAEGQSCPGFRGLNPRYAWGLGLGEMRSGRTRHTMKP